MYQDGIVLAVITGLEERLPTISNALALTDRHKYGLRVQCVRAVKLLRAAAIMGAYFCCGKRSGDLRIGATTLIDRVVVICLICCCGYTRVVEHMMSVFAMLAQVCCCDNEIEALLALLLAKVSLTSMLVEVSKLALPGERCGHKRAG